MRVKMKAALAVFCCLALIFLAACAATPPASESAGASASSEAAAPQATGGEPAAQQIGLPARTKQADTPKYVFLFIGDGMSFAQVNAARIFSSVENSQGTAAGGLSFTEFPVTGMATTYDETSVCPDSASSGTAIACGRKTASGVLGMLGDKQTPVKNIAELFKEQGRKIGILTTVTLNNATPAAFYAHVPSRGDYYDISMQMAQSGVDYFAGGALASRTGAKGDKPDAFEVLEQSGYTIADTVGEIAALGSGSGRVYAVSPVLAKQDAMPFALDAAADGMCLRDFVSKGIEVLAGDDGFFMVCESGKIDWACHANDAMSAISETLVLADAVSEAVAFAQAHPDDTLILVTSDHETGGMAIGCAASGYNTDFSLLAGQKLSYSAFNELFERMEADDPELTMDDVLPVIKESFGLAAPGGTAEDPACVMTDYEYGLLAEAFKASLRGAGGSDEAKLLYGGYEPLTVTLTHILNNKAGIGWTTYAHTGGLVPVFAYGAGAEEFGGCYDNTDIFKKLAALCGLPGAS